jgi:NAD-dependent dihydropyrimidine dehydrogenase PreA subunit
MSLQKFMPEDHERMNREERTQLLESIGVKEVFNEGEMEINRRTCRGVDCRLCIQACPTNALYWKEGEVGIVEELCVYCTSCVNVCMIDNCIHVSRVRSSGETEKFSSPQEIQKLLRSVSCQKANERTKSRCAHEWPFLDSILEFSSDLK